LNTLDFSLLDDLALAAQRRKVDVSPHLASLELAHIGPLVELLLLSRANASLGLSVRALPNSRRRQALDKALSADWLGRGVYVASHDQQVGFIATKRDSDGAESTNWTQFCRKAQEAAEFATMPKPAAQAIVGALREIEENVHIHSNRAVDGIAGFSAKPNEFEFVVGDSGIGMLQSLRQHPDYAALDDAGTALRFGLENGQSRYGRNSGRGWGFNTLFIGLANMNGVLRFRTEDHGLVIDGLNPSLVTATLVQRATLQGFMASVVCRLPHIQGSR
jgi:hypothetical protein